MKEFVPHLWVRQHLWLLDQNLQKQTTLLERKRGTTAQLLYSLIWLSPVSAKDAQWWVFRTESDASTTENLPSHSRSSPIRGKWSVHGVKALRAPANCGLGCDWLVLLPIWPMLVSHADTPKRSQLWGMSQLSSGCTWNRTTTHLLKTPGLIPPHTLFNRRPLLFNLRILLPTLHYTSHPWCSFHSVFPSAAMKSVQS